jgi:hypothetical protein
LGEDNRRQGPSPSTLNPLRISTKVWLNAMACEARGAGVRRPLKGHDGSIGMAGCV